MRMTGLNRAFKCLAQIVAHHGSTILIATGIVSGVAGTIAACKATTKAGEIIAEMNEELELIDKAEQHCSKEEYSEKDIRKDKRIVYMHTAVKFAKLYAPAATLGALAITCILSSHNIMRKQNAALAAAYTAIDQSYTEYRNRVTERFGEDVEKEILYDLKARDVKVLTTDENGNTAETTESVVMPDMVNPKIANPYARFFDESCIGWTKNAQVNRNRLIATQNTLNDMLKINGYVYLNQVYDALGVMTCAEGARIGWVYDPDNTNWIDFGMYNVADANARAFVDGYERNFLVDLHPDGIVYDLLKVQEAKRYGNALYRMKNVFSR